MKILKPILISFLILLSTTAFSNTAPPQEPEQDTIIVSFGKRGKMVIYVDNKKDLKVLKSYDLNALLSKINLYLDSANQEDYMNDTTFTFHTPASVGEKPVKKEVRIKVETLDERISEIEDNLEKTAENIEEAGEHIGKVTVRIGSLHIEVEPEGHANEKVKVYRKHEETKRIRYYFSFHSGLNNYFDKGHFPNNETNPYALDTWGSRYFAVNFSQKVKISGPLYFTSGIELAFNNYMFRDDVRITKSNGQVEMEVLERDIRKSKLATTYLNVPVMVMVDFKGKFKMGAGAYGGYRLSSHNKVKYTSGDNRKEKDRSDFYLNDWRYGLRGMIGVKSIKFFANYDLNSLFKEDRAPKLNSFSFGIII